MGPADISRQRARMKRQLTMAQNGGTGPVIEKALDELRGNKEYMEQVVEWAEGQITPRTALGHSASGLSEIT